MFDVLCRHQIIQADVLIAATSLMTLTESEYFVHAVGSSRLGCNHSGRRSTNIFLVGWVHQLAIPSITRAFLRVLTTV